MPKHTFLDTILNRPSQSYVEPSLPTNSSKGWQAPSDLPNVPKRPQSLLSSSIFRGKSHATESVAPSVSGMSTSSRFSRFRRKKKREPSISSTSLFPDQTSVYAPTLDSNAHTSSRKSRWWEAGSFKLGKQLSRPPSVIGSIFSEPEASPHPLYGFPSVESTPTRGARSVFGGSMSRRYFPSSPLTPVPPLTSKTSISSLKRNTGVSPLGQQPPSLVKKSSKPSLGKSATSASLSRATSVSTVTARPSGAKKLDGASKDWREFVKSMSGTEVAQSWESMPTSVPQTKRTKAQMRKNAVERLQRELEDEAQFEQLQTDSGLIHQDLLTRVAQQVIGQAPFQVFPQDPLPTSTVSIQPGTIVPRAMSPILASDSSPVLNPPSPFLGSTSQIVQHEEQPLSSSSLLPSPFPPSLPSADVPVVKPIPTHQAVALASSDLSHQQGSPIVCESASENESESESEMQTTLQDVQEAAEQEESFDESVPLPTPSLAVVAEEEEETSSNGGHGAHHEMKSHASIKGQAITKRFAEYDAVLHRKQSFLGASKQVYSVSTDVALQQVAIFHDSPASVTSSPTLTPSQSQASSLAPQVPPKDDRQSFDPAAEPSTNNQTNSNTTDPLSLPSRPPLQTAQSSTTQYESASSGRSTPVAKQVAFESTQHDTIPVQLDQKEKPDQASIVTRSDTASQRPMSIKSSRSWRHSILQRRLSDVSLGTSFALSGMMDGRRKTSASSRRIKLADNDSDSSVELSDQDEDLKAQAMAEQDRLRRMNVGDDFFGPSLATILDRFDRTNFSDSTIDQIAQSSKFVDNASVRNRIVANAQQTINDVRQNRARAKWNDDAQTRSSSAGGYVPSAAALWLLNESVIGDIQSISDDEERATRASASDPISTHVNARLAGRFDSSAGPDATTLETPRGSVLNRPRPKARKPQSINQLAEEVISPVEPPEDTRSSLPFSISSNSFATVVLDDGNPPLAKKAPLTSSTDTASKDGPPRPKSAMKGSKQSKSLADTLFSFSILLSDRKTGSKNSKQKSADRIGIEATPPSAWTSKEKHVAKGARNSLDNQDKPRVPDRTPSRGSDISFDRFTDALSRTSSQASAQVPSPSESHIATPEVGADTSVTITGDNELIVEPFHEHDVVIPMSEKAAGKRPIRDDSLADASVVVSQSETRFATPSPSMATLTSPRDISMEITPPQTFHTAMDLKALSAQESPIKDSKDQPRSQLSSQTVSKLDLEKESTPSSVHPPIEEKATCLNESSANVCGHDVGPTTDQPNQNVPIPTTGVETNTVQADTVALPSSLTSPTAGRLDVSPVTSTPVHQMSEGTLSDSEDEGEGEGEGEEGVDSLLAHASQGTFPESACARPASSEVSAVSTALTMPTSPDIPAEPFSAQSADIEKQDKQVSLLAVNRSERKLPLLPTPKPASVATAPEEEKTPTERPKAIPSFGINLIPPTPPTMETRNSYTGGVVPATPPIAEEPLTSPQRPSLVSRSSSQRVSTKPLPSQKPLTRSKSTSMKNLQWKEYHGKGLNLPNGLIATTVATSVSRRHSVDDFREKNPPRSFPSNAGSQKPRRRMQTLSLSTSDAPGNGLTPVNEPNEIGQNENHLMPSPKSKRHRHNTSPGAIVRSATMNKIMADLPPVPKLPSPSRSLSPLPSRTYAQADGLSSGASSSNGSDERSVSPVPSNVPSPSGKSNLSHVSSGILSSSHKSSPRPEYTYAPQELSACVKKLRSLSPGPGPGPTPSASTLVDQRHSLMTAINEWESQMTPEHLDTQMVTPISSRPASPRPYPSLPASTISRGSSAVSAVSSPSFVRHAPLGAPTNVYLHPPIARSRMTPDRLANSLDGHLSPTGNVDDSVRSSILSSPSEASRSVTSLPSTIQTVPTSYRPNKDPKSFSSTAEDLLHTQTTMQTIAVSSGAFPTRSRSVMRRKANSDSASDFNVSIDAPEHLRDQLSQTTLSLTAHTPPPRKINSTQVLVQVIAVAIDETDRMLLREKVHSENAFGYIPGRSFCGRAVECGYQVKKMRKGDVVFGLQHSQKCGALAEFMTIDQNLICHAPIDCLTAEQIAALPSVGVLAHQMLQNHCNQLPRGARVLVLNAHDGIGLLTMQASAGLGLILVAQCPPSVSDGVTVCQANGAHEVVMGEPLWAINSLHESSFDLVVDTVGGRRIYDASRRILAQDGQFATCFGDDHSTANPDLRSHFRSLRRAFFKKDKKNIGYEWVGFDTGEDCKEALEAVKHAAEAGNICPRLRSILPFQDAPRAFDATIKSSDEEPGAIVVRIS